MYTAGSQGGTDVSVEEPEDRPHARVTTELHGDAMQRLVRTAIDDKGPLLQPSPNTDQTSTVHRKQSHGQSPGGPDATAPISTKVLDVWIGVLASPDDI